MSWTFQSWYGENKERWNGERRTRYQADPEYRAKVREWNRKRRLARTEEQRLIAQKRKSAVSAQAEALCSPAASWRERILGGKPYVSMGALSQVLGLTPAYVRQLVQGGKLPQPEYRTAKGDRFYTPEQALAIVETRGGPSQATPIPKPRVVRGEVSYLDGTTKHEALFLTRTLARAMGRSVVSVQSLEASGVLPPTPFVSGTKRLYTVEMIDVVRSALTGGNLRGDRKAEFHGKVLSGWEKLNILDTKESHRVATFTSSRG